MKKVTLELIYESLLALTTRINHLEERMDNRFEKVDKRFEKMEKRFDKLEEKFDNLDKNHSVTKERITQTEEDLKGTMDYMINLIPDLATKEHLNRLAKLNNLKLS